MKYVAGLVLGLISTGLCASDPTMPLTDKAFAAHSADKGVLLVHVNWGRQWNCHGYENAQLQKLVFHSLPVDGGASESIVLDIPSRLLAKNAFQRYALLVSPAEYALSGFRLKLAASVSDLRIYELDAAALIADGKPKAGSFRVAAGEIVYVGHFAVDCNGEPSPWRFYIEDAKEFSEYSAEFHREFPSTQHVPVTYRLFETSMFGTPFALPVVPAADAEPNKAMGPTR